FQSRGGHTILVSDWSSAVCSPDRVQATRTPIQSRATRTPTPVAPTPRPANTATRVPPTRTPTRAQATRTPIQQRATRTPIATATRRATRTPIDDPPPPTQAPPVIGDGLVANCSLRRNVDFVTITMIVENRSDRDLDSVRGSPLQLEPEGGASFFDRTGPSPNIVGSLRSGTSATIQWTGRLSAGGTMGFSAFATANSANGP